MSASYSFATSDSAAEARSLEGKVVGDFRIKEDRSTFSREDMQQQMSDYYARIVAEVKRGERIPVKLGKWKSVEMNYQRFLIERIPHNFKTFEMKGKVDGLKLAFIPASFNAPHPTFAEKDAYMKRWDMDGDLYQQTMAECRKHNKEDSILLFPQVIHSLHPKSVVMVVVAVIVCPKDI